MARNIHVGMISFVLLGLALGCRRETPAAAADSGASVPPATSAASKAGAAPGTSTSGAAAKAGAAARKPAAPGTAAAPAVIARICGDDRDVLLAAYTQLGIPLTLKCDDFTQTRGTEVFGFADLVKRPSYGWVLLRDPLLAPKDKGFGLDLMIQMYGGAREINSSYRDPIHNQKVGGARRSRHLFGDAADVRNVTRSREEWDRMWAAAEKARADYIEPLSGPCKLNCLHADWRNHDGSYGR